MPTPSRTGDEMGPSREIVGIEGTAENLPVITEEDVNKDEALTTMGNAILGLRSKQGRESDGDGPGEDESMGDDIDPKEPIGIKLNLSKEFTADNLEHLRQLQYPSAATQILHAIRNADDQDVIKHISRKLDSVIAQYIRKRKALPWDTTLIKKNPFHLRAGPP
ncbi:hypothetical protein OQA88_7627 [Cercophora sp. LCS_1]